MRTTALTSTLFVLLIAARFQPASAGVREGIFNGGFELGLDRSGDRPAHWIIGFPDQAPPNGSWTIAADPATSGHRLELRSVDEAGFFVTQAVDLPASAMEGVEVLVTATVDIPEPGVWAAVQMAALNPEAEIDPSVGFSHVGYTLLTATSAGRHELTDSIILSGPAELISVALVVSGSGSADFDNVSVTADIGWPSCGPPFHETALPSTGLPAYPIGFTNESVRNISDRALSDLTARLAESSDLVNLFAHIRWNALAGLDLLAGHQRVLTAAEDARRYGLQRMLTLDFTHADIDGIGDVNPMPDGTPVGRLDDPGVSDAYVDELEALVRVTGASIVSVGIETDFFWTNHPDQWSAYRSMLCSARDRLHSVDPSIHVTTYFTLEGLVHPDLSPNLAGQAAFRELGPCIDSVGYSYYPCDGVRHLSDIPPGMFEAAQEVAPGLPLIIPEFGHRTDGVYSEREQVDFLRRAMDELSGHEVVAMVVYSLYDQTYFGAPPFFQDAFRSIGVLRLDGSPKEAWRLLRRIRWSRDRPIPTGIAPSAQCVTSPRHGGGRRLLPGTVRVNGTPGSGPAVNDRSPWVPRSHLHRPLPVPQGRRFNKIERRTVPRSSSVPCP